MLKHTALYAEHQALGARLVDFAGWEMPIQYTGPLEEHHAVRNNAGMFDVAHMCAVDIHGPRSAELLRYVLANDVTKLRVPGAALYTCMLREDGGVIDDLIVYMRSADHYRLVVNAGTADKDIAWLQQQATAFAVEILPRRDLSILAVQGPQACALVARHVPTELAAQALALKPFHSASRQDWFVSRTGYTGEDGFELVVPHDAAVTLWRQLLADGVKPCGLGARDTLRLEAGMNLYGQDMDETVSPLASGLGWTLALSDEREFIGKSALLAQRAKGHPVQVGLVLEERGVLRAHMPVRFANGRTGEITSGGFAPSMKQSIALARVDADFSGAAEVKIRENWLPVRVVKPPFVRHGKLLVS